MDVTQERTDTSHSRRVYTRKTKKKLQEQSSTKVQKLQGQSASTSTQPRTLYLISRLPLFVTEEQLRAKFETYGEIVDISFVHRRDRNYTISCVLDIILHDDTAGVRLVQAEHEFGGLKVTVELCTGNGHRVLEIGKHELVIRNVKVRGSYNTNGQMIYNFLQARFHKYSYSEMELMKSSIHKYTGEVVIFFHSANGRQQAREWIRSHLPKWEVVEAVDNEGGPSTS